MAKEKKQKKAEPFDLEQALEDCPKPEWVKKAFLKTIDVSKIKNESDLKKQFKTYGEMK